MAAKIEEATFHYNCGSNVQLSDQDRIAQRTDGFVGIVFTNESIPNGYIFQVKIISEDSEEDWGETLSIGVTTNRPDQVAVPGFFTAFYADKNYWVIVGNGLFGGRTRNKRHKLQFNLEQQLRVGHTIGLCITEGGDLHCFIDGDDQGTICNGLPADNPFWGVVGINGRATKVQLLAFKKMEAIRHRSFSMKEHAPKRDHDALQLELQLVRKEKDLLQQERDNLLKEKDDLMKERDDLRKEKDDLVNEKDDLRKGKDDLQKEKDDLQKEKDDLQKEKDDLANERDNLQKEKDDVTNEKDELRKEKDDLTNERDDLRRELDDLKREKDEIQQRLNDEIDVLKGEKEALIIENNNIRQGGQDLQLVETLRAEKRELEEQKQMVERERDDLRAHLMEMQAMQQDTQELQGRIARLSIDNMKLQGELKEVQNYVPKDESWKISHEDLTLTEWKLGGGGWGEVLVGIFREQRVAVKRLYKVIISDKFIEMMHHEINTMTQLRHPNLLQFIGAVLDDPSGHPLIITEIMDISLRDAYEKKQLTPVPVHIPLAVMRDAAVGLNYLHCLPDPIIHRDVSSANVLLESKGYGNWKTKISDFGSAKFARTAMTKAAGAAAYSAPEAFQNAVHAKKQTPKMDVYSYGILLWEVMNCKLPDHNIFSDLLQQLQFKFPPIHDLVQLCILDNSEDRPTMRQVIAFIDGIDCRH